ncbi:hypothetical protein J2X67_005549 [Variovorax sp. 3319]|nr:hypothetical protein [Variovorax sp. 3319]
MTQRDAGPSEDMGLKAVTAEIDNEPALRTFAAS